MSIIAKAASAIPLSVKKKFIQAIRAHDQKFHDLVLGLKEKDYIINDLNELCLDLEEQNKAIRKVMLRLSELQGANSTWKKNKFNVKTQKPVAYDSPDHINPWGTKRDNSTNFAFNLRIADMFPPPNLRVLDLGCSGGGFVKSIHEMGCLGIGVEGSDYSQKNKRAEWATIPNHLFTADISVPFEVTATAPQGQSDRQTFNIITAWEVLEHLKPEDLPGVWSNIRNHLEPDGFFIGSISLRDDIINGVNLHQTVKPMEWWIEHIEKNGLKNHPDRVKNFGNDWVRWEKNAAGSFHVILSKI